MFPRAWHPRAGGFGATPAGPRASCPAVLQSLSGFWCEPQVDPWEAVATAVWGLVSQTASYTEESLLTQPSPRCGWLHLTGHSANLETTAVTRTLPCAHGSGWVDIHPWTSHWSTAGGLGPVTPSLEQRVRWMGCRTHWRKVGRNSSWKALGSKPAGQHVPGGPGLAGLAQPLGGQSETGCRPPGQAHGRPRAALQEAPRPQQQGGRASRNPCRAALKPESVSPRLCPSPAGRTASSWRRWRVSLLGRAACHVLWLLCHQRSAGRLPWGGRGHVTTDFPGPAVASPVQQWPPLVTELTG